MATPIQSLLYNGTHHPFSCDLLNRILGTFEGIRHVITLDSFPEGLAKIEFKTISHFEVDYFSAMNGIYPQADLEPLDQSVLDQFNPYWFVALKMMDRHSPETVYSYQARIDLLLAHIKYWNTLLTRHQVDCFISNNYPHEVFDYVIYALCKAKVIKTLFFDQVQVEGHVQLLDSIENNIARFPAAPEPSSSAIPLSPLFESHWQKKTAAKPPYWLAVNQKVLDREKTFSFRFKKAIEKMEATFLRLLKKRPPNLNTILRVLFYRSLFGARANQRLQDEYNHLSITPTWNEPFIYAPLHFQPECSSCPMGGYFVFQELIIELLEKTLPPNVKIYIKEHPFQKIHGRPENFYKKLSSFSKVVFVDRKITSSTVIQNSIGVATITGTAGWEALFLNKRVLLFGAVFFQYAPGVYRVKTKEDCEAALQDLMLKKDLPFSDELRAYVSQLDQYLIHGWVDPNQEVVTNIDYQENLKRLVNALAKRLNSNSWDPAD